MERRTFIRTLLLSSGALMFFPQNLIFGSLDSNTIKLLMIYNNIGSFNNFESLWGLSTWIENKETAVLFDTGGDTSALWNNIENSGINIKKLSKIVISHFHWDHLNGLPIILEKTNYKPDVFVPNYDLELIQNKNPKANVYGIKDPIQLNGNLWSTGQMKATTAFWSIHEQSLIITHGRSIYLLTGCAHPGIVEIVKRTKTIHPDKTLELVTGGFHLRNNSEQEIMKISNELINLHTNKLAPSHCTGDQAIEIFKREWKDNFIDFTLGKSLKV